MKNLKFASIAVLATILFFSCTEKEPVIPTPKVTIIENVDANFESVTLSCTVSGNISAERLTIEYSKEQSLSGIQKQTFEKNGDTFLITISGLEIQTTYYYRYTIENKASSFVDEKIRQFKTLDYVAPIVKSGVATDISGTMATISGTVEYSCGKTVLERGFLFGMDKNHLEKQLASDDFTLKLSELKFETNYFYQAFATSEIGTGYGDVLEFSTNKGISFKQLIINNITATSASVEGGVDDNGGIAVELQGYRYCEKDSNDIFFIESAGEATLSNLKAVTSYKVWFYAKTFEGEFESDKIEFATTDGSVSFGDYSTIEITAESISLSTSVNNDGGSSITQRGFAYGTKSYPTIDGDYLTVAGTTGQMAGTLSNLSNNTVYYIRAFAKNAFGVSYGSQTVITTLSGLARMGQTSVSEIQAESATFTSDIVTANGATITAYGFCYGLSKNPTTSDNIIMSSSTSGAFSATANSLKIKTTYYVRSFATTKYGTSYGVENSFTTNDGIISFTDLSITAIKPESAIVSVRLCDDGGSLVTERGFCYATAELPTVSNNKVTVSSSEATYSGTLSSLSKSTKYFVRAYAKNATGTYYSSEENFFTTVPVQSISLNKTELQLAVGASEMLLVTILPSDATDQSVNWTCSSPYTATVTQSGLVYGLSSGSAIVTATVGDKTATCVVTVVDESTPSYWDGTSTDQSWYTVGQAEYHIKTAAQLAALSNLTNQNSLPHNVVYHLDRDIDLNNYEWNAIGCVVNNYAYYFRGTFDGHGHTIKNLNITKTKTGYTSADGLFGVLADNAEVNNLNVEGTINLDYSSNPNMTSTYVGGVIGWGAGENSLVTNCHSNVNITVISSGAIVGGIVGVNGDPVGCSSKGAITVSGSNQQVNVGGIVGSLYQSSSARDIARCSSSCTITVSTSVTTFVGGIVGLSYGRHISDIIFSGNIISKAQGFCISGGLIGHPNTCTITNGIMIGSYQNNGNSTYMGAISGSTSDTNFYNCYYLNSLSSSTSYGTPVSVSTLTSGSPLSGFSTSIWAFPSGNYPYIKYD